MLPDGPSLLRGWRHVVKLDPDKPLPRPQLRAVAQSGTDALILGGTQGITRTKVMGLLAALRPAPVPVLIELSSTQAVLPGADGYLVPVALNSPHHHWLAGAHLAALTRWGARVPWRRTAAMGYIMLNPASAAARQVGVADAPDLSGVLACVRLAAGLWRLPAVYLEYSGRFGSPGLVARARRALDHLNRQLGASTRLIYGGGIDDGEKAAAMAAVAHTVVVGNVIYRPDGVERLRATVRAVRALDGGRPGRGGNSL